MKTYALLVTALVGLAAGGAATFLGEPGWARWPWAVATVIVILPTLAAIVRALHRKELGVDIIALAAMAGAIALGEYLAGAVIAVMLTGGTALERFAAARARRELTALLKRAPRVAHRREGETLVEIDVDDVAVGDVLVVKPGEVVPTDGLLLTENAVFDESTLTGEAAPVTRQLASLISSGVTNLGQPIEIRATRRAADSTYAGIIRLVQSAEGSKAPLVRLADRYASWFLGFTFLLAGGTWLLFGDPVRALAVLVVATPCPLILAAPVAIVSGLSRAARHGLIIKGGGPLETLARATHVLLDKTGTITAGRPRVVSVETLADLPADDLVFLAASVDQLSTHPLAPAILREAADRGVRLVLPTDVEECVGMGIQGLVAERRVSLGRLKWAAPLTPRTAALRAVEARTALEGSSSIFVAVDGVLQGAFVLVDPIRAETPRTLRALRRAGVKKIIMVTGDRREVADLVGDAVGVDQVYAERTPEEKVAVVHKVRGEGVTLMAGDGVNDAPSLATAHVGVALGARGATAASESADVVLTADRLEGLVFCLQIAQRSRRIALQSIWVGMGLSGIAMIAAAAGHITPTYGAVLQEVIDLSVILNALRALGGRRLIPKRSPATLALGQELHQAHRTLRPRVEGLAVLASRLSDLPPATALVELRRTRDFLVNELLPHEAFEQQKAYPVLASLHSGEDPTDPLIQTHFEIARLVRFFQRLVDRLPDDGPHPEDMHDLLRSLYGLQAILALHFAQEDEQYSVFVDAD